MHSFPSERAWWFAGITWILLPGILIAVIAATIRQPPAEGVLAVVLAGILPMAVTWGFTIWIWFSTGYTVTEQELLIRSAFLTWRVPLPAITGVQRTMNPLSSPALSLNRLQIRWAKRRSVMISPADQDAFLQLLRERCPQADIPE